MSAQIIKLGEGYFYLKVTNYLNNEELSEVWEEVKFLSYRSKCDTNTNTADIDGVLSSNKIGVFLEHVFTEKKFSNYLKYSTKWFTKQTLENLLKTHFSWRTLKHCEKESTLLSYYEDSTYYKQHVDTARLTQLFYIFNEPKKFQGGDIVFSDFNHTVEIENNMLLVFPSWFVHEVKPVIVQEKTPNDQDKLEGNGRYVFTTFYD